MGPGVVIGLLYARLARAYWSSQQASLPQSRRLPNPRVPCLILGIVLLFWACFLPFWLWQLLAQYRGAQPLTPRATRTVNYLTTCLTYGNSCVNPFLYTHCSPRTTASTAGARCARTPGAPTGLLAPAASRRAASASSATSRPPGPSRCPRRPLLGAVPKRPGPQHRRGGGSAVGPCRAQVTPWSPFQHPPSSLPERSQLCPLAHLSCQPSHLPHDAQEPRQPTCEGLRSGPRASCSGPLPAVTTHGSNHEHTLGPAQPSPLAGVRPGAPDPPVPAQSQLPRGSVPGHCQHLEQ